jgi:hypothetical protein
MAGLRIFGHDGRAIFVGSTSVFGWNEQITTTI